MDVVKAVGKYLDTPIGSVCYNTDRVLTTVLDKENIEGFASIILRLAIRSGIQMTPEQSLLSYQWLEHIAMYGYQAIANPIFAKNFLQGFNRSLEKSTYLTGNNISVADIAAYHILYTLIERLSVSEREPLIHVCRWSKHVQSQPKVGRQEKHLKNFPLPKQVFPHELNNVSLDGPVVYHPQPFSFPGYPIILYL